MAGRLSEGSVLIITDAEKQILRYQPLFQRSAT
jgi:hypothetical protein